MNILHVMCVHQGKNLSRLSSTRLRKLSHSLVSALLHTCMQRRMRKSTLNSRVVLTCCRRVLIDQIIMQERTVRES